MAIKKPSLLSGTLPKLQETGKPIEDANANLSTLKSQYHPGTLPLFQQVMGGISERVYKARQSADAKTIGGVMDPTKVSGGTFSNVLGWLEQNRGKDISSMYSSTMQGFMKSQENLSNEIKYITKMRDDMKNNLQDFKVSLAKDFPGVFNEMSSKDRQELEAGNIPDSLYAKMDTWSKDVHERELRWEEDDRAMDKVMHEIDMEYKQAQTDKTKQEVAENQKVVGGAVDKMKELREGLTKQRQTYSDLEIKKQEGIDQGSFSPTIPTGSALTNRPYNTPEEVDKAILEWTDWAGDNLSDDTIQAGINSLYYSLDPNARPVSAGIATAESKMEMQEDVKMDGAINKIVNYFRIDNPAIVKTEDDITTQEIIRLIKKLKDGDEDARAMSDDLLEQLSILGYDYFD